MPISVPRSLNRDEISLENVFCLLTGCTGQKQDSATVMMVSAAIVSFLACFPERCSTSITNTAIWPRRGLISASHSWGCPGCFLRQKMSAVPLIAERCSGNYQAPSRHTARVAVCLPFH